MLKQIKVRNFKNFRDEIVFSLNTPNNYEFNNHIIRNGIINNAMVVGRNASGKTNLGYAIMDITMHLTDKLKRQMKPYTNLYNDDAKAYFEYTFEFNKSTLVYKYEKTQPNSAIREELFINNKQVLKNDGEFRFVALKGTENLNIQIFEDSEISLVKYVYSNTILDEKDGDSKAFVEFMKFVNGMLWFSSTEGNRYIGLTTETGDMIEKILEKDKSSENLQRFLKELGIDYSLLEHESSDAKTIYCKMGKKEVPLAAVISSGTRSLIFFYLWYLQNENITFAYIDEFDAFYHTSLAKAIVECLVKLYNVQTIVTTHNTDLITNEILRPDCIFELRNNKIEALSDLTSKALREAHNLQKMYKAGAFNE